MQKIKHLFKNNGDRKNWRYVDEIELHSEWVVENQGVATRKWDGTACLIKDSVLYKRREVKKGKADPEGFFLADGAENTDRRTGWVLPLDSEKMYFEVNIQGLKDGTYELVGPKVNGNPENFLEHKLIRHGIDIVGPFERTFEGIKSFFSKNNYMEGLVFHHQDGRMVKCRLDMFGIKRDR